MRGYKGMTTCAVVRSRQLAVALCHTCGSGLFPVAELISPEIVKMSPLAKVTFVGYQRPAFIFGSSVQVSAKGSKMAALGTPVPLPAPSPPVHRIVPSGKKACPPQKMLNGAGVAAVIAPVAGFQKLG